MRGLGFGSGYVAQGGDIGAMVSCLLGERFEACKGKFSSSFSNFRSDHVLNGFDLITYIQRYT